MIEKELKLERLKRLREKLKAPKPSNVYRVELVSRRYGRIVGSNHIQIKPGHLAQTVVDGELGWFDVRIDSVQG